MCHNQSLIQNRIRKKADVSGGAGLHGITPQHSRLTYEHTTCTLWAVHTLYNNTPANNASKLITPQLTMEHWELQCFYCVQTCLLLQKHNDFIMENKAFQYFPTMIPQ